MDDPTDYRQRVAVVLQKIERDLRQHYAGIAISVDYGNAPQIYGVSLTFIAEAIVSFGLERRENLSSVALDVAQRLERLGNEMADSSMRRAVW